MDGMYRPLVGAPLELGLRLMASRFLRQLGDARAVSRRTLESIIALNGGTVWGRRMGLDGPHALAAFQALPTTTYQDYAPLIERAAAGEPNVLTGEPITYFAVTSGTTGAQKLIPVTRRQTAATMELMQAPSGLALVAGALAPVRGRSLLVATEQVAGTTPGGIPKGAATSNGLRRMGKMLDLLWTSPATVMQVQDQRTARYLHLLFALGEERLWAITAFFPSTLLFLLRDLHARADELLRDLADGTISRALELPLEVRAELSGRLRPNPQRARRLRALREQGLFTVTDIWPDVRLAQSVGSGAFRFYVEQLRPYLGAAGIFSAIYGASEAMIGIGLSPRLPGYALAPAAAYHEFLPLADADRPDAQLLTLDEVEQGRRYEIVVTTYSGLTRYRLGDIVQVVGLYGHVPLIEFVERRGQVINIVGEKTGEAQITRAFEAACRSIGAAVLDYVVTPDPSETPARYLLLLEDLALHGPDAHPLDVPLLEDAFERELRLAAPLYAAQRQRGALGPVAADVLAPGAFERFRDMRVAAGASAAQVKVPHVVPDPHLAARLFGTERRIMNYKG